MPHGLTFHLAILETLISWSVGHIFKKTSLWYSLRHKNPNVISYPMDNLLTLVSCDSSCIVYFTQPLVDGLFMLFPWSWFHHLCLSLLVIAQVLGLTTFIYFHSFTWSLSCHYCLVHRFCLGPSSLYLLVLLRSIFLSFMCHLWIFGLSSCKSFQSI